MASQTPETRPTPPPPAGGGMIGRAQRIIMSPAAEWDRIDAEPMTEQGIMTGWVAPLAAIGPVATLIGSQLFGWNVLGVTIRTSLGSALAHAVISWLLAIGGTFVLALIIDALAPTFGGTKNRVQALKVAAYSATAAWLAGIFGIVPALAVLAIVGLYSLYLFWVGLPKLMKVPADKAIGYVAATIVAAIVLYLVIGAIAVQVMPTPGLPSVTLS